MNESQQALKHRLDLLCKTWTLFKNAKEDAKTWEVKQRGNKRKRDHDDEDIEIFSQSSKRTTRSQSHSSQDSQGGKSGPSGEGGDSTRDGSRDSDTHNEQAQIPNTHKRKWASSSSRATLTENAVLRLAK